MAARKAKKSAVSRRAAAKKSASKKTSVRGASKNAVKRTRRAGKSSAVKSPRIVVENRSDAAPERKAIKKADVRPSRPPAVLPIPQATFFF